MKSKAKLETAELLFEIGCEEIPAGMIAAAANDLQVILQKRLEAESLLSDCAVECFGAPRRLVAVCEKLRIRQEDNRREAMGPPKSVAFDAAGRPTRAAESFAAKNGVSVADLQLVTTPRGEYVVAEQMIVGRNAVDLLVEILPRAIAEIPWPKTMYWTGKSGLRFIRPIRWVVALFGGRELKFAVADIHSGAVTSGHRFLGKERIPVTGYRDYVSKLRKNYVLTRPEERRKKVERELGELTANKKLTLNADPALSEQVVYLNEYPTAILGDFDPKHLELPEEILITVMRDHQKYFAVRRRDGKLAPHFLAVINLRGDAKGIIAGGHERVLRARFADARFFWETDQKGRLADNISKLAKVTFQAKLGSYAEKVERVREISRWLAERLASGGVHGVNPAHADRAAELAKCDLVTDMVREFTELQGVVGGLYAKVQGEHEDVCDAIYDHYRPVGIGDPIPRNLTGSIVAIADKLDTLVGCFTVGLVPTGSSDPFALRRAALGIVKIILERELSISLADLVSAASHSLAAHPPKLNVSSAAQKQVVDFLVDRARYILTERGGFAHDDINAVVAAAADDLVDLEARAEALRGIRKSRNFDPLAVSFKRIRKILEKAGDHQPGGLESVRADLFESEAERKLHAAALRVARNAEQHKKAGRYRDALQEIAGLRQDVDDFFDGVMVMAEQEQIRQNRLALLGGLLKEFSTIADFSEIAPAEK